MALNINKVKTQINYYYKVKERRNSNILISKIIFLLTNLMLSTQRPAISGQDVVVNDIKNPYNQQEITEKANLKAYIEGLGEVTNYIILVEDDYKNNSNKEGVFEQKYIVNINGYEDYYYVLLIYNVNFNQFDKLETIKVSSTTNVFLTESTIITKIIEELHIKIFNYQLIEGDYSEESDVGKYYQSYLITTTNRERINVLVEVNVYENENTNAYLIIGVGVIAVFAITLIVIIKRKRVKNV